MGQSQSNPSKSGRTRASTGDEPGARNRALAKKEAILRRDLSQKSQEAWARGDRAGAGEYSLASKKHLSAMETYNTLAAREIFISHNPKYLTVSGTPSAASFLFSFFSLAPSPGLGLAEIDLHGLYVQEALPLVKEHLVMCRKYRVERTAIITGKGLHSVDGIAKIRPQVEKMLNEERVRVVKETGRPANDGVFVVEFMKPGEAGAGWGDWLWNGLFGK